MQFLITAVVAIAATAMAIPLDAPAGVPLEEVENQLQARGGLTCKLKGGPLLCAGKCYAAGKAGGYCASNDICTCY